MSSARRLQYLEGLGLQSWQLRAPAVLPVAQPADEAQQTRPDAGTGGGPGQAPANTGEPGWEELRRRVAACTACALAQKRTQTVFGVGDVHTRWLIIGEAPGAEEDRRGEPFVGPAGQLLNSMLRAVGLAREQVYITNIVKCRPPGNRDPRPEEARSCAPFLQRQIELIQPALILVVGRVAAQNLLGSELPLARLRQTVHRYGPAGLPLIVTYHPAYLLRSLGEKRKAWEDLKLARRVMESGGSPA